MQKSGRQSKKDRKTKAMIWVFHEFKTDMLSTKNKYQWIQEGDLFLSGRAMMGHGLTEGVKLKLEIRR